MKKLISLLLVLAMVLSFAACSNSNDTADTGADQAAGGNAETPVGGDVEGSGADAEEADNEGGETEAPTDGEAEEPTGEPTEDNAAEPDEVTVTGMDANGEPIEVTVPYKPERVVVLDLANLDILDNLGMGDRIVGAPTITLPYLQSYNDDLPIVGSVKTPDLEAVMACEPDLILMGGRMAEYYEDLWEIAPMLRLDPSALPPGN